jgi:hypothetical protein
MYKLMIILAAAFITFTAITTAPAAPSCHKHTGQTHCH